MELKWLKDFVALSEHGSFSKAAEARFVTQPAFSRRIRSLENWLGIPLVDREKHPTTLSVTGLAFVEEAKRMIHDTYRVRERLQGQESRQSLVFFSQHSPAVSFFPHWIRTLEPLVGPTLVKLNAGNLHDVMESFMAGMGDFLLCYSSDENISQLSRNDTICIQVGTDKLVPVSAVNANGTPLYSADSHAPFKLLAYPDDSYLGSLIKEQCLARIPPDTQYTIVCENALAEGLKAMAIQGYGVAWLPSSLIQNELQNKQLAILPSPLRAVELKILLYRFRHTVKPEVDVFWKYLIELYNHGYA
ncbi:LysR family transcriptional regulator [Oceanisphaera arctica]|uniref:LysR family transcriptional regulator n=1 Tax=Oceanisphaera arctica TaxID=641510 RepID=A0A2P5TN90_9GAMM|nr:LysR family transcriptional regulator [Oceanisphaera arctica]PPL16993.1 LysR family transcriptional regulator [Oceanisphaera arctica]GHA07574.1 transcriptional regulator [Oceanisphaera arctica]